MPSATTKNTPTSSANSAPKGKVDTEKLLELVYTLQFAWFVGNVLTVVGFIASTLTFLRILPSLYKIDYLVTLLGVLISFGILVLQLVQKNGLRFGILIRDDNTNLVKEFALDSFLSVQLIIELEEVFGIEIDMEEIDMEIYKESGKLKKMIHGYLKGDEQ